MAEAKFRVSLRDGIVEFEGDQVFVEKQIAAFGDLIKNTLSKAATAAPPPAKPQNQGTKPPVVAGEYPKVIEIHDDQPHIIASLTGDDKEKIVNVALLLGLGNQMAGNTTPRRRRGWLPAQGGMFV